MPAEEAFYGWKLVAVLWFLDFLNMGFPFYGGTVINTYMLKEMTMSRSLFGLGFTLLNLFVGFPSLIVAASITNWGVRKTFGIGSVQKVFPLDDGSALILSIAKYFSPSGKEIQENGVTPSVAVEQEVEIVPLTGEVPPAQPKKPGDDAPLKRAIELLASQEAQPKTAA